jgi:hypothetical protein
VVINAKADLTRVVATTVIPIELMIVAQLVSQH